MARKIKRVKGAFASIISQVFKKTTCLVFEKTLSNISFDVESSTGVDASVIERADFTKLAGYFKKSDYDPKKWFNYADLCIVAKNGEDLVHWTFVTFHDAFVGEIERKIRVRSNVAYLFATTTVAGFRRRGIATEAIERICHYLYEKGIQKVYIMMLSHNSFMLKVLQKVKARKIGSVMFVRLFDRKLYKFKGETEEDCRQLTTCFPTYRKAAY